MNRLASAAVAAVFTSGLVLASAGSAHADPYECYAYVLSSTQTVAGCHNGTGTYRATCICDHRLTGTDRRVYGPTVRIGQRSIATCAATEIPTFPSLQVVST